MKIAVFLPNWVGDAVMATPAIKALRLQYPDAEIVGVMRPFIDDTLAGTNLIDRSLHYDPRGKSNEMKGWKFIRRLRSEQFDSAVLFPNSLRSGFLAWASGAKRRIGTDRDGRGFLLTDRVTPADKAVPNPVIEEYLKVVEAAGCQSTDRKMILATTDDDEQKLADFWRKQPETLPESGTVCLNPGGAFGAAKHWPTESFAKLAVQISDQFQKTVLVLCGPAEREIAKSIVSLAGRENVVSLAEEKLSLGLTKAAVKSADLLVTTDSGPRHFAQPFGVPVVTLFGPTHIAWSETFYAKSIHLQIDVDCGPCQQRICPLGHHKCMTDLSVDRVFRAVEIQLQKYASVQKVA